MQHHESQKLVLRMIATGFMLCFILFITSLFWQPDMGQNPPKYQKATLILQSLAVAMLIFSSTLLGLKLTEEKRTLAAAGFTMFAIANGVEIVAFFEIRHSTFEEYEKVYDIFASATALLIPACVLMTFYDDVPKWLRFFPVIFLLFQLTAISMYYGGYDKYNNLDQISFIGYLVLMLNVLLLGIFIWKQATRMKVTDS